jgi:hypothetical protein
MRNWNHISLYKFQRIEEITSRKISDIDKTLWTVCVVFDKTEYQLDNMPLKKAQRLISGVEKIFASDVNTKPKEKVGRYKINYDPSTYTFGQYIELAFFLQEPIKNMHYVLASVSGTDANKHKERAEYFLNRPVTDVLGGFSLIIERFTAFNDEYKGLFGLDTEVSGESATTNHFYKRYGWIYSASQVADYERITLDQAFALPIRRALNDLAYLKAKSKFEAELIKKRA